MKIEVGKFYRTRDGSLEGNISGSWWEPKHIKTHLDRETKSEPPMVGVVDGLADIMDRLRAIGNGQVPIVAATAWRILTQGGEEKGRG